MTSAFPTKRRPAGRCVTGLGSVLLATIAAQAQASPFSYQLDSARVAGNASGGAGCFEEFVGGLGGWTQVRGDAVASAGLVTFQNPGALEGVLQTEYDLDLEREDIQGPSACFVSLGGGDAIFTTVWVNHLPALPGGYYQQQFVYALSPTLAESITVSLERFNASVAGELGIAPGLHVSQSRLLLDSTDPNDIVLAAPIQSQTAAITESELANATGERTHLRLTYEDSSQTVYASYSLDGEATYQSPFTPLVSNFGASIGPGLFWAGGGAITLLPTEVPSLSPIGSAVLAGLLLLGASLRRARRLRP